VIKSSSQRLQSFLACSSPMTCNGPSDFLYVFMRSFWHNEGMQQFIIQISFLQFLHPPVFCPTTGWRKWLNSSDSSYSRCSTCWNSRKWNLIFHPACFRTQKDIKVLIELLVRSLSIPYDTVKFAFSLPSNGRPKSSPTNFLTHYLCLNGVNGRLFSLIKSTMFKFSYCFDELNYWIICHINYLAQFLDN